MSEYIVKCNEVVGISGKTLIVPDYIDTSKEIVRCRDCRHAEPEPPSDRKSRKAYQGGYWCDYWFDSVGAWCPADGFCFRGERKDGEE